MKHLFIINPASGKGKSIELIDKIKEKFRHSHDEYIIEITKYPGHAKEIVKEYVKDDCYRVYAVGGDGTLNEVLNGIVGSDSSLGVIPVGSGNDFARTIYSNYNIDNIIQELISGKEKLIDIGKINDKYFLNVSSVGIDAEVTRNAVKLKRVPMISGSLAYLLSIFMTLINYASCILKITVDDNVIHEEILLAAIGNGIFYGGGMKVLPKASITDSVFDLCVVRNMSKLNILRLFPLLIKGEHESIHDFVTFHKGRKIQIEALKDISINIDGEIIVDKNLMFEILPKSLKFIVPK